MIKTTLFFLSCGFLGSITQAADFPEVHPEVPWQDLVINDSLEGWKQLGGLARYDLIDGVVVGRAVTNTRNSFLTTEKHYGDFALEYEFKVDPRLNSGVQVRSNSLPDYRNGQVHGYQVEIDPDMERKRLWTAGIYEEGRRGWLNDLKSNDAARAAFKPETWNHIRVMAVGDHIQTWLNGVPAADLRDSMTMSGFIGLQVHGIGNDETKEGALVSWRKLRIKDLGHHEWKPLFNGKDITGWRVLPGGEWEVVEGMIKGVSPKSESRHGILLSERTFKDFAVRLKFRVSSGDSGFYWRALPVKSGVSVQGFQVEVDSSFETGGLYETGGRGWVVKPDPNMIEKNARYRPGEWTDLALSAHGPNVNVFINGRETARLVEDSASDRTGHFGLQLHGGMDMDVLFKDIEILQPAQP